MHFYELRHFGATHLLALGVSHANVAVQLGHSVGGNLVMSTYGHPSDAAARERLKRAYAVGNGAPGSNPVARKVKSCITPGSAGPPNQSSPLSGDNISRVERDEGDDVLDLETVDLGLISEALEDHSPDHAWWFDPRSGEVEPRFESWSDEYDDEDPESRGLIWIAPIDSSESYRDLQDFIACVRDHRARDLLERAISGREPSDASRTPCSISPI